MSDVQKGDTLVKVIRVLKPNSVLAVRTNSRFHPRYRKLIQRTTKLWVHDETTAAKVGDTIVIRQCAPVSKTKSWKLVKVVD